jgi:hypothetical protein
MMILDASSAGDQLKYEEGLFAANGAVHTTSAVDVVGVS